MEKKKKKTGWKGTTGPVVEKGGGEDLAFGEGYLPAGSRRKNRYECPGEKKASHLRTIQKNSSWEKERKGKTKKEGEDLSLFKFPC